MTPIVNRQPLRSALATGRRLAPIIVTAENAPQADPLLTPSAVLIRQGRCALTTRPLRAVPVTMVNDLRFGGQLLDVRFDSTDYRSLSSSQ